MEKSIRKSKKRLLNCTKNYMINYMELKRICEGGRNLARD